MYGLFRVQSVLRQVPYLVKCIIFHLAIASEL